MSPLENQIRQIIFDQAQDYALINQSLADLRASVSPYIIGLLLALLMSVLLFLAFALAYHPRTPRGGFWIPAFGVFGSAPKLYSHSRPSSLLGFFLKKRHRVGRYLRSRKTNSTSGAY